ncbi:EthD domain-containing protein [Sphingobium sp. DC-2]|uniref:EthD domain-containing protein n=1 Tax=Sphingobium sp. DC-2 TaxID=1303256 RepID=UPI0004C32E4C|nr:EthD domain-containing protein [Sphingobium sp. DC-2]
MLKVVAAVRRRPGMTYREFIDYIVNVHGGLTLANPLGLARYVQNHVVDGAYSTGAYASYGGATHRDSVTELYFRSPDDLKRTFTDPYTITVIAPDGEKFSETATTQMAFTRETCLSEPYGTGDAVKIIHFLFPEHGSTAQDVQARWDDIHAAALAAAPALEAALRGLTRSDALPLPDPQMARHFGGADGPAIALMISLWVAPDALEHFRAYEKSVLASGLLQADRCYFLICKEHQIYPPM